MDPRSLYTASKQSTSELYAQTTKVLFKVFSLCFYFGVGGVCFYMTSAVLGSPYLVKLYNTVKCPGGLNASVQKPGYSPETPSSVPELQAISLTLLDAAIA